jgi:acyl carrier protein
MLQETHKGTEIDSIRTTIVEQIELIGRRQNKTLAPLTDALPLLESGLDSLCIAVLVAALDDELGLDPFSGSANVRFPVTLGEFIACYENVRS